MKIARRDFITTFAAAAAAPVLGPFSARAQQAAMPTIGFLHPGSQAVMPNTDGFRRGLKEAGYIEGQNVAIEYRWAEGRYERIPAMAAELVARHVVAIAVGGGSGPVLAAKAATQTIPILFFTGTDPITDGLVASFARPGGNLTGAYVLVNVLVAKQLQLLHEVAPTATTLAALDNASGGAGTVVRMRELNDAALALGVKLQRLDAGIGSDLGAVFAALAEQKAGGLVLAPDPYLSGRRDEIAALAVRARVPVIGAFREDATAGCLMSYGPDLADGYRLVGDYAARILKGANPAELPVQQSTKVELVINLKTAKALGLTFPLTLLGRADEVIE